MGMIEEGKRFEQPIPSTLFINRRAKESPRTKKPQTNRTTTAA